MFFVRSEFIAKSIFKKLFFSQNNIVMNYHSVKHYQK